jgi:hypothetical protein
MNLTSFVPPTVENIFQSVNGRVRDVRCEEFEIRMANACIINQRWGSQLLECPKFGGEMSGQK